MNKIIDKETVQTLVDASKGLGELVKEGTTTLVDETIKLYIFYGVMGILKACVVFVVFGVVLKFLNTLEKADTPTILTKSLKTTALVISMVYFTIMSMPHILDIGKAVVAPNLFIAEKGLELVKKVE